MKLPIRNYLSVPLTLYVEPFYDRYDIPPGGEAIVTLEDGRPHSIDFQPDNCVTLWDEGSYPMATVEVFPDREVERRWKSPSS